MRQLIVAVVLASCAISPVETPADLIYGCFLDEQDRTYCVDPNPVEQPPETGAGRGVK